MHAAVLKDYLQKLSTWYHAKDVEVKSEDEYYYRKHPLGSLRREIL